MRKISALYAWQSDTPQEFNRHLIEIALQDAATRINEDSTSGVQVEIDSDTKGVPGTSPITETRNLQISYGTIKLRSHCRIALG